MSAARSRAGDPRLSGAREPPAPDAASGPGPRRPWPAVALVLLVAAFWWWRFASSGREYDFASTDLFLYFYPLYQATYGRLAAGVLPLWNPYQLCGMPWLAPLAGGFFYPTHVLYLVLPTHVALGTSSLLHLVLIALTTRSFARRAGLAPAAGLLAAVLFTLRGSTLTSLLQPSPIEAIAWLPLGSIGVLALARAPSPRAAGVLALSTGLSLLAGYPQMTVYLVYGWAALLLALLLGSGAGPRRWLVAAGAFGGALVLGGLLAAVQLVPSFELGQAGGRGARRLSVEAMFPMGGYRATPSVTLLRFQAITGAQGSFGVVGLSLLGAALVARRHRTLAYWAAGLGVAAAACSLGPLTPLFRAYLLLPAVAWFRSPFRLLLLTDFCFALLAAVGLDALATRGGARPGAGGVLVRVLLLGGLVAGIVYELRVGVPGASLLAAGAAAVLLALVLGLRGSVLAAALLALAAVEVFQAPAVRSLFPFRAEALAPFHVYDRTYSELVTRAGHDRVWIPLHSLEPPLALKQATVHRLRAIDDYEPLNLRRAADYFTFLAEGSTTSADAARVFDGTILAWGTREGVASLARRRRLLDLAAMRFLVVPAAHLGRPEVRDFVTRAALLPQALPGTGLTLLENPHALPRAFTVYDVRPAPGADTLLAAMSDEAFDPLATSYVEGEAPAGVPGAPARGAPASITHDEERRVEVDATLAAPGLLVLADAFFPGWQATVDGRPAPILPTNHLFRGVPLPAGTHHVRFEYRPWTVAAGATTSLAALLAVVALLTRAPGRVRGRRPRRRRAGAGGGAAPPRSDSSQPAPG